MRDLKPRLFHLTCFLTTGASWNWPLCHLPPNQINKTHKNKERDRCNCGILVSLSLSQQIVLCSLSRLVPHLLRVAGLHSCLPSSLQMSLSKASHPVAAESPRTSCTCCLDSQLVAMPVWVVYALTALLQVVQHSTASTDMAEPRPSFSAALEAHGPFSQEDTRPASHRGTALGDPFLSPALLRPGQTPTLHALLCTGNAGGLKGEYVNK